MDLMNWLIVVAQVLIVEPLVSQADEALPVEPELKKPKYEWYAGLIQANM